MEGLPSCLTHMLHSMKAAQAKLTSDPFSMGDFLKNAGAAANQPTLVSGKKQYVCELCRRCFTDPSNLRRHKHIHSDLRPYECAVCGSSFRQKSQLDRHHLVHTGERPFQCPHCMKGFRDSTELRVHLRVHTGERPYSCPVCEKGFSRICYMKRHQQKHSDTELMVLRIPEKKPLTAATDENQDVAEEYQCSYCNDWFLTKKDLEGHRVVHLKLGPTGQKLYECAECKKCFNNSSNLRKHAVIHTGLKPFTCKLCNQSFRQATHLQRHHLVHTGEKPFKCSICLKGFRDASDLLKHQRIHKGDNPYQCRLCQKTFNRLYIGKLHREHHQKEGFPLQHQPVPPRCVHMSDAEDDGEELESPCLDVHSKDKKRRVEEADEGEQILKCSLCSRTFTRVSNLHRHYLMHTGYRPFNCHICCKTFQQMAHLDRHRRLHHREVQSDFCMHHEAFHESEDLLHHREAHVKDRPFRCHKCDKTYTQIHYLETHQKSHQNDSFLDNEIPTELNEDNSIEVVLV